MVRGLCFEFAGTGIYGLVHGADTHAPAQATYAILAVEFGAKGGNLGVGKPKDLGLAQKLLGEHWGVDKLLAEGHQRSQLSNEPGINARGLMYLIYRSAEAKGQLDVIHAALGWALQVLEHRLQVGSPLSGEVLIRLGPETIRLVFQRTHDLIEARDVVTADAHGLAHRLHGGSQGVIGTRELLKSKARGLDNDVVQGGLEGGLGLAGDVVLHLVQGVADGELGRQLSNWETGGLGCQRGGTGHARVHLDDDDAAVIRVDRKLDITAASIDADLADDGNAQVTHLLELTVSEGQRRGDGDGIAGVHAEGVDIFDGGNNYDVVVTIAHELELVFLPAQDGFLNEHVGLRGCGQAAAGNAIQVLIIEGQTGAQTTHGEGRADYDRQAKLVDGLVDLIHVVAHSGAGGLTADGGDDVLELLAVLATLDGVNIGADELNAVLVQNSLAVKLNCGVQRSLAAQGSQHGVDGVPLFALLDQDLFNVFRLNGFDVGVVRKLGVGHDGGRIGVDQRYAQALFLEHAAGLGAGVVELASLADDDWAGADDQDVVDVVALWHSYSSFSWLSTYLGCG